MMRWPINPDNNPKNVRLHQTIMVPHKGRKFRFTKIPGASYATVGEVYTCSGYPNTNDSWGPRDISITSVETGAGTFDRLQAWEYAEWEYV